jgi:hypothetical protein
VPALPDEPFVPPRARGISFPPAAAAIDPAARPIEAAAEERSPALVRVGFEESAVGDPVRLVIKPLGDAAGRGGISFAVEPRDAGERLVPGLASDLVVTAYDAALPPGAPPIASWTISGAEVRARFRPTGRHRGIAVDLPWQGTFPTGDHVRLRAEATTAHGPIAAEALVPAR